MHETRLTFLAAAAEARAALILSEVEERWDQPSALEGMTVGALAAHLARAVITVQTYLGNAAGGDEEPISAASYFGTMEALRDPQSPLNVGVRSRAAEAASHGNHAVIESFDACVGQLRHSLAAEPDDRVIELPNRTVLELDEYLLTRILELTVHTDDLCVSIGRDTPALTGLPLTIQLLIDIAELRHGEVALLRALSRRERDPGDVLPVL